MRTPRHATDLIYLVESELAEKQIGAQDGVNRTMTQSGNDNEGEY